VMFQALLPVLFLTLDRLDSSTALSLRGSSQTGDWDWPVNPMHRRRLLAQKQQQFPDKLIIPHFRTSRALLSTNETMASADTDGLTSKYIVSKFSYTLNITFQIYPGNNVHSRRGYSIFWWRLQC